ncbi:MAG: hypothetical protein RIF41_19130 [Polyangiaceae bacterium]
MSSSDEDLAALLDDLGREFDGFRIIDKRDDGLSHLIDRALRLITLGGQDRYLTHYHTVIGDRLYDPDGWARTPATQKIITLRHERVHLRQRRRYTLPGLAFLYLVFPFPLGLAYGRARLEWEAYRETLRATYELEGGAALLDPSLRERIVSQFTGPAYGWMWPFRAQVERWYDEAVDELLSSRPAGA